MSATDTDLAAALTQRLTEILGACSKCGPEFMEIMARRIITTGVAGYQEAMGAHKTAEALYRMADELAVEGLTR